MQNAKKQTKKQAPHNPPPPTHKYRNGERAAMYRVIVVIRKSFGDGEMPLDQRILTGEPAEFAAVVYS
jgi:hypothetical protein